MNLSRVGVIATAAVLALVGFHAARTFRRPAPPPEPTPRNQTTHATRDGAEEASVADAADDEGATESSLEAHAEALFARHEGQFRLEAGGPGRTDAPDKTARAMAGAPEGVQSAAKMKTEADAKTPQEGKTAEGGEDAGIPPEERARLLFAQARDLVKKGEFDQALALLQQSVVDDPLNGAAYRELGALYHRLGRDEEEIATYAAWAEASPAHPMPQYYMARTLERQGRDAESLAALERFNELSAGDVTSYSLTASIYRRLEMPEEEGAVLTTWVNAVPDSADARQSLANYYRRTGNQEAALAQFQTWVDLTPDNPTAHLGLGDTYQRLREYDAAQREYVAAMNLRPSEMRIRLHLAESYRSSGDLEAAIATYQAVLEDSPGSSEAQRAERQIGRIQRR